MVNVIWQNEPLDRIFREIDNLNKFAIVRNMWPKRTFGLLGYISVSSTAEVFNVETVERSLVNLEKNGICTQKKLLGNLHYSLFVFKELRLTSLQGFLN